jgi:tRNA (mo5U34)-methyltransferase
MSAGTDLLASSFTDWVKRQIAAQPYWFQRIELPGGMCTPGWSDPRSEKLPYFGLPDDMHGMRVLDIGHAEGFFSFEAERRGAEQVCGIEMDPRMIVNFNICRSALNSQARSVGSSVYELDPKVVGTFDMVFFFGVLYHLRHPLLALERVFSVCSGTLLIQTATLPDESEKAMAEFHPAGIMSGTAERPIYDPTCFWFPNPSCCKAMLEHVGFQKIERIRPKAPGQAVFRAHAPVETKGAEPDGRKAPWS